MQRAAAVVAFALRIACVVAMMFAIGCSGGRNAPALRRGLARLAAQRISMLPPLEKDKRRHDATVYVDGVPVAIVKFLELPPKLKPVWKTLDDGRRVRRYRMVDYLEALGIDLAKVRQVHVYGGRGQVGIIEGAELARNRGALIFSFTQSIRGKLNMNFPGRDELAMIGEQVDIADDIAVYRDKPPPRYEVRRGVLLDDEDRPWASIPYAPLERPGGTRVYVDGVLVASIKRKTLPEKVVVPGTTEEGKTRFSLEKYLEMVGVDLARVRGLEAVADDAIVATVGAREVASRLHSLEFTMPRRSKGLVAIDDLEAGAKLEALLLYVRAALPTRETDHGGGSPADHATADSRDLSTLKTAARSVH